MDLAGGCPASQCHFSSQQWGGCTKKIAKSMPPFDGGPPFPRTAASPRCWTLSLNYTSVAQSCPGLGLEPRRGAHGCSLSWFNPRRCPSVWSGCTKETALPTPILVAGFGPKFSLGTRRPEGILFLCFCLFRCLVLGPPHWAIPNRRTRSSDATPAPPLQLPPPAAHPPRPHLPAAARLLGGGAPQAPPPECRRAHGGGWKALPHLSPPTDDPTSQTDIC